MGAALRAGRGRDRRRRPAGLPAAALVHPRGVRRPRPPRPAGRPRRRAPARAGPGAAGAPAGGRRAHLLPVPPASPRSASTCATARRSRALAARFELLRRPLAVHRPRVCLTAPAGAVQALSRVLRTSRTAVECPMPRGASGPVAPELPGQPLTRAVSPVGPPGAPWHCLYFLPEPQGQRRCGRPRRTGRRRGRRRRPRRPRPRRPRSGAE